MSDSSLNGSELNDSDARLVESIECCTRQRLAAAGLQTRVSWLFERPALGIPNGRSVDVLGTEIVYRVTDPKTLLIVLYRRKPENRRSLSNSFAGICWFMEFLKRQVPSLQFVSTLVDVFPYAREKGISSDRLTDFCTRCGGALTTSEGHRWIRVEIAAFVPLRAMPQGNRLPVRSRLIPRRRKPAIFASPGLVNRSVQSPAPHSADR